MLLKKFVIITHNEAQMRDELTEMLINTDQIVSIKPIKVSTTEKDLIDGYWIRLTNGKKYKAVQVPAIIHDGLSEKLHPIQFDNEVQLDGEIRNSVELQ